MWWGHRIPVWYIVGKDCEEEYIVARSDEEALAKAHEQYGKSVEIYQDPDVLDTWFSRFVLVLYNKLLTSLAFNYMIYKENSLKHFLAICFYLSLFCPLYMFQSWIGFFGHLLSECWIWYNWHVICLLISTCSCFHTTFLYSRRSPDSML